MVTDGENIYANLHLIIVPGSVIDTMQFGIMAGMTALNMELTA